MTWPLKTRITLAWLVLVGITATTLALSRRANPAGSELAAVAVLAAAFIKVHIVAFEFMELRRAPRALQWAVDFWLCTICIALCVLFWRSGAPLPVVGTLRY
jgi:heme/copper-type cytochrome/quinol oxidase subunit 4